METFRGHICNNDNDYRNKERMINTLLYNQFSSQIQDQDGNKHEIGDYSTLYYCGGRGVTDVYHIDGRPILIEPKRSEWANEMPKLPLNFQDLDKSIIRNQD